MAHCAVPPRISIGYGQKGFKMYKLVKFESREVVAESPSIKEIMDKRMELIIETGQQFAVLDENDRSITGKTLGLLNYAEWFPNSVVLVNDAGKLYPVKDIETARKLAEDYKLAIGKVVGYDGDIAVEIIENKV
jgi:hypothetical protein